MTEEQAIRTKAHAALAKFGEMSRMRAKFGYNRETVAWLEGFIERQRRREDIAEQEVEDLIQLVGSFLGECLISKYGGAWRLHEGSWAVFFSDSNAAFPFSKVRKQFEHGIDDGESILGFFDVIPLVVIKQKLTPWR
ncbi:MAG TPA: hypothetical protein VMH00_12430 [Candidatus Limnocylindrales bacterium]|nr:hypothetical protein [Candidatus Limnocylindrales bacterium]